MFLVKRVKITGMKKGAIIEFPFTIKIDVPVLGKIPVRQVHNAVHCPGRGFVIA